MDSYNILPLILQEKNAKGREIIFSQGSGNRANVAIRKGEWKLIIKSERDNPDVRIPIELYNLADNIFEKEEKNLIDDPQQKELDASNSTDPDGDALVFA